jgi:tetratricopeptide (TPR) repeat protein
LFFVLKDIKSTFGDMNRFIFIIALLICSKLSLAQSNDFYSMYFEANSLLVKGQYVKAIENYNKALKLSEKDYLYFNRGNAYFGKKDYPNAMLDYDKALLMNKGYTEAYCQRGLVKSIIGDKTCCDDLKKAIKLDSPDAKSAFDKNCVKKK